MNLWKVSTMVLGVALCVLVGKGASVQPASAEAQPQMRAALASLKTAKRHLEHATHDKGGHRTKAIVLTNEAIDQVEKGIAADDTSAEHTKKAD